jgi:hypothetical protein
MDKLSNLLNRFGCKIRVLSKNLYLINTIDGKHELFTLSKNTVDGFEHSKIPELIDELIDEYEYDKEYESSDDNYVLAFEFQLKLISDFKAEVRSKKIRDVLSS